MRIHLMEQGSPAWLSAHIGVVTASELGNIVDSKFDRRDGKMVKTYMHRKLAEWWRGQPIFAPSGGTWYMEQGLIREQEAIPWFEFEAGIKVDRVGFCQTDDSLYGCSPDGIIGLSDGMCESGIEVKSPDPHTHVGYLLGKKLPVEYAAQVHMSMFVTGCGTWQFLSYRPGFPNLLLNVDRDEEIQEKIADALQFFTNDFEQAKTYLIELNGGEEPERIPFSTSTERPKFSWELDKEDVPCP